jgi:hypothetical protein
MGYKAAIAPASGLAFVPSGASEPVVLHPPAGTVGGEPFVVYGNMRVVYGVDTLDYVPGPEFLADVGRRAAPGTTLIFRRRPPGKGHGYRAVAERNGTVLLYVDETETKDSVKWLVLHELAHILVTAQPTLAETLRSQPRPSGYPKDDAAHEAVIEEQVANAYADLLAPVPGLDRRWWRKRTQAMGYGDALSVPRSPRNVALGVLVVGLVVLGARKFASRG